jgi:hypothetical protein
MADGRSARRWHVENPHSMWVQRWQYRWAAWRHRFCERAEPALYMSGSWLTKQDGRTRHSATWYFHRRLKALWKRVTKKPAQCRRLQKSDT